MLKLQKQKMIVDTSIWIEYFKNRPEVVKIIEDGLMNNRIFIIGPSISELLQGVKSEEEYDKLVNCIEAVPYLQADVTDWKKAGSISFQLRKKGITIPLTDVIISAVAVNNEAEVYTLDQHFAQIPEVVVFQN